MNTPFDPHPKWRKNFAFTMSYPNVNKDYKLDTVIAQAKLEEFKLDPTIHKFTLN